MFIIPCRPNLKIYFGYLVFSIICFFYSTLTAQSQILKTSPGIFQHVGKHLKVILSYEQTGIFVLFTSDPIELQLFEPMTIKQESNPLSLFITYNPELDRYTGMFIGGREYKLRGNVYIESINSTSRIRLNIDNNNPYLSIVVEDHSHIKANNKNTVETPPCLLGFRGLELVANYQGQKPVALLEANQFNQYNGVIQAYTLSPQELLFKGKAVETHNIGIELESPKNQCLNQEAIYLRQQDLSTIASQPNKEEGIKELERLMKREARNDPLNNLLLLRIEKDQIIGLDYIKGLVKIIRPLSKHQQKICVLEEMKLEEG